MSGVTRWFAVGVLAVLVAACSEQQPTPEVRGGPQAVAQLGGGLFLGRPMSTGNLTVWPIYPEAEPDDPGEFVTLEQAQQKNLAVVRELDAAGTENDEIPDINIPESLETAQTDEDVEEVLEEVVQQLEGRSARVDTLVIENKGDKPILVLAGTVVKGGKQDRQIGQDFVIQAGATVPVDAFCVERGRWTASRGGIDTEGLFLASRGLAPKDVRKHCYDKDQAKVWEEVANSRTVVQESFVRASDVPASSEIEIIMSEPVRVRLTFNTSLTEVLEVPEDVADTTFDVVRDRLVAQIESAHPPVGFAYAINGQPTAARAFAHSRIFRAHLDSLATSVALEARLARAVEPTGKSEKAAPVCDDKTMANFLSTIDGAIAEEQKTRAANTNKTRRHEVGYGNDCVLAVAGTSLVLTRDWTAR
ncbi:MAG: DUF6569 family protein [Planctomycetota bacterium]